MRAAPAATGPDELLAALRRAVDRGARVLSVCTGAFVLGAAGLLDDRGCTTHWRHADRLARMYPAAKVDPSVLYVDDGDVITSAGTAAGIDACLYLVRKEQGSRVANAIARRMVVPPHRDGGQAQYVERPVAEPACDTLGEVLEWMQRHLDQFVTVDELARLAAMSPRTFARRFVQETGHDAAAVADRAARPAGPAAAGGDRRDRRRDRGTGRVRERGHVPPSLPGLALDHAQRLPAHVPRLAAPRGAAPRGAASGGAASGGAAHRGGRLACRHGGGHPGPHLAGNELARGPCVAQRASPPGQVIEQDLQADLGWPGRQACPRR